MFEEVEIEKIVHGGQGLGQMPDGRKVFVWGALPGEKVLVRVIKKKRSYVEAIAEKILMPAPERVEPREPDIYLSTSPWQIVDLETENKYKQQIVNELFTQAHVSLPQFDVKTVGPSWNYRNKMEYSFWGDENGLHLALHRRGSHHKVKLTNSVLAMPAVDQAAQDVCAELQKMDIRAGDLKTIIVRCNQKGQAVASLFVKSQRFPQLVLPQSLQGIRVYHSNPQSPASVPTKLLYEKGGGHISDVLAGKKFLYDAQSFFQVNLPIFEEALKDVRDVLKNDQQVVDMYAGVGSIGLSVAQKQVDLVELDASAAAMARTNAAESGLQTEIIEASTEKSLDYIKSDLPVIFDPPRAGLHAKVTARTLEAMPPQIIYLSCNPSTQARDLAVLQEKYKITDFKAYNFFPHTPHIETLAVLERK
jgi:23S rRNA (uracil1939-C5)-methyltransferase